MNIARNPRGTRRDDLALLTGRQKAKILHKSDAYEKDFKDAQKHIHELKRTIKELEEQQSTGLGDTRSREIKRIIIINIILENTELHY